MTPSRGAANAPTTPPPAPTVVVNEVESNSDPVGDWIEVANTDPANDVDVSGWYVLDSDDTHTPVVFPSGSVVESGGYLSIYTDTTPDGFGLGGDDSARLFDASGTLVSETSWSGHAPVTWGRCPDMTGDFAHTSESTPEQINACEPPVSVETQAWPWLGDPIVDAAAAGVGGEDASGLDFGSDGALYAANNGSGEISRLTGDVVDGFTVAES
ncbi:MAG: lamin tail domain-containing protein [Aeromicrobium sp.]|uniref:lamin tail domain-containing protein n=1 Tax=Aeromicrobium sp. TaxID=1871063 RepID=UPI0039E3AF2C